MADSLCTQLATRQQKQGGGWAGLECKGGLGGNWNAREPTVAWQRPGAQGQMMGSSKILKPFPKTNCSLLVDNEQWVAQGRKGDFTYAASRAKTLELALLFLCLCGIISKIIHLVK